MCWHLLQRNTRRPRKTHKSIFIVPGIVIIPGIVPRSFCHFEAVLEIFRRVPVELHRPLCELSDGCWPTLGTRGICGRGRMVVSSLAHGRCTAGIRSWAFLVGELNYVVVHVMHLNLHLDLALVPTLSTSLSTGIYRIAVKPYSICANGGFNIAPGGVQYAVLT